MIAHAHAETSEAWKAAAETLIEADIEAKQAYESGTVDRLNPIARGIYPLGSDADTHYPSEMAYFLTMERARKAVRDHGLVKQGINRLLANLQIGSVTIDVDSGDPSVDADIKAWWKEWSNSAGECDFEGERTLGQMARQSMFSQIVDGDIVHLPLADGRIQTFEAHHLRNPGASRSYAGDVGNGIVHGVEVKGGRVAAYHLTPQTVSVFNVMNRYRSERYGAWNEYGEKAVLHLGFKERFHMRRGVSVLSAPRNAMTGFDELNWAHINSAKRRALISFLVQEQATPGVSPFGGGSIPQTGARDVESDQLHSRVVEILGEPAAVIKVRGGQKLEGWNADMPGAQFFEHAALLLSMLSVNLDIPLSILLLDGSLTNFHGGRMVIDQARMRFRELQSHQIDGFYAPIFRWKMRQRLEPGSPQFDSQLADAVARGLNPFAATFRAKGWAYVKPTEDVAAEDVAERRNLRSLRTILADRGIDLDDHIEQIISDRGIWARRALQEASAIAAEYPAARIDVGQFFREIWYGPDPSGVQLSIEGAKSQLVGDESAPNQPNRSGRDA